MKIVDFFQHICTGKHYMFIKILPTDKGDILAVTYNIYVVYTFT